MRSRFSDDERSLEALLDDFDALVKRDEAAAAGVT